VTTVAPTAVTTAEPSAENTVVKGDVQTVGNAEYTVTDTKSNAVAYTAKADKKANVTIPDTVTITVNGTEVTYKVTSIADNAFKNDKTVKKVTIGSNITTIGKNVFKGCKNLKTITISSKKLTAKNVSKSAFKGIPNSKKVTVKVPKSKYKAYKTLLRKKGLGSKVKIKAY
jgi:hypothetical protein